MLNGARITRLDHVRGNWRVLMIVRALLCLSIIAAGLALRGFGLGLGLSAFTVKYGGSIL